MVSCCRISGYLSLFESTVGRIQVLMAIESQLQMLGQYQEAPGGCFTHENFICFAT